MERYSRAPWEVVGCNDCGFVFLGNPPDYVRLEDELAWEKSYVEERKRRVRDRPVVEVLENLTSWRRRFSRDRLSLYKRLFKPGPVLDVGCGGNDGPHGPYVPYGIEISRDLFERSTKLMAERGGYAVHGPAAEAIDEFPDTMFTGVIMSSILEHEVQPTRLLTGVARVLRADGCAYIRVPNYGSINRHVSGGKWCGFRHPDHVNYFTETSLRRMGERCGLSLSPLHRWRQAFDDNINAAMRRI
ncbi:MAG: class I SAM-dependent methyltransferase [Alphaproteobacteria bacterium]